MWELEGKKLYEIKNNWRQFSALFLSSLWQNWEHKLVKLKLKQLLGAQTVSYKKKQINNLQNTHLITFCGKFLKEKHVS